MVRSATFDTYGFHAPRVAHLVTIDAPRVTIIFEALYAELTRASMPIHPDISVLLLIALAGLWAGTQNTLAGGGSFITFPALLLAGLGPLAANITSTVALFPNQITASLAGRDLAGGVTALSLRRLFGLSIAGGVVGAVLLLETPASFFARLVPWLVLFATAVYAWGSFRNKPSADGHAMPMPLLAVAQFLIGIYGGYFGGGIGFLMLAALTLAGQQARMATATKNILAMAMNASAVAIFVFSGDVHWLPALALALGGIVGALLGGWLMHRLPERLLRGLVVLIGIALTVWLFIR
ncbi:MAG: Uncharacterized UPF0721 integral membrane protein [Burkholderiaceae bacterium]|jgi:uncharacterized membrane protein YfcA|nr:MAG: Uncharacterized UPF0721 integral membrane protein [Burkholderiaceae bacterium]